MTNMPLPGMGMGMPPYGLSPYSMAQQFMGYGGAPPAGADGYPGTPWHNSGHYRLATIRECSKCTRRWIG